VQSDVTVEGTVQTPCGELAVERPARVADPATLVIFGATGDLAKRKLLPALYNLNVDHLLPEGFGVIGRGREPLTTDAYRERVSRDLQQFGTMTTERGRCEWLESRLTYLAGAFDDPDTYDRLRDTLAAAALADGGRPANTLFYDTMTGDSTNFHRVDIVEAGWRVVDPILREWTTNTDTLHIYPSGSWGPSAADALLARDGREWRRPGR
jgi:glucose-6-phosphate 1-dehydrogenase